MDLLHLYTVCACVLVVAAVAAVPSLCCGELPARREATPPEMRLQRERERELKELERATRTVFAYNLNIKADERDIYDFFCKAGEVRALRTQQQEKELQLQLMHGAVCCVGFVWRCCGNLLTPVL